MLGRAARQDTNAMRQSCQVLRKCSRMSHHAHPARCSINREFKRQRQCLTIRPCVAKHRYSSACLPSVDAYLILSGTFRPGTSCTRHCPWLLHVLEIQTICMVNPWPLANIRAASQRAVTRKAGRVGMKAAQCACVYRPSRLGVETGLT